VRIPLEIRKHYTIRRHKKNGIQLNCDQCGAQTHWSGTIRDVAASGNAKILMQHTQSHHGRYYSVAQVGEEMVAAHLDEMTEENVVKRNEDAYVVHLRADNLKHAIVKGAGMIRASQSGVRHRRTWRDNFR
jgi:purine nucleoside permease